MQTCGPSSSVFLKIYRTGCRTGDPRSGDHKWKPGSSLLRPSNKSNTWIVDPSLNPWQKPGVAFQLCKSLIFQPDKAGLCSQSFVLLAKSTSTRFFCGSLEDQGGMTCVHLKDTSKERSQAFETGLPVDAALGSFLGGASE